MTIFIAIAVPVVIVLIVAIVVITLCINTVRDGYICVVLDSDNKTVSDKVYSEGTHLISPLHHFSAGLPAKTSPMNGGVFAEYEDIELKVFIVFKFYVEEKDAFRYFDGMANNYTSNEYEIENAFVMNATNVVTDVMKKYNCAQYDADYERDKAAHEEKWKEIFYNECKAIFEEKGFPFTLNEKKPVQAVIFFDGCGFPRYN